MSKELVLIVDVRHVGGIGVVLGHGCTEIALVPWVDTDTINDITRADEVFDVRRGLIIAIPRPSSCPTPSP